MPNEPPIFAHFVRKGSFSHIHICTLFLSTSPTNYQLILANFSSHDTTIQKHIKLATTVVPWVTKSIQSRKTLHTFSIWPIIDFNGIVYHFIECIYAHLNNTKLRESMTIQLPTHQEPPSSTSVKAKTTNIHRSSCMKIDLHYFAVVLQSPAASPFQNSHRTAPFCHVTS